MASKIQPWASWRRGLFDKVVVHQHRIMRASISMCRLPFSGAAMANQPVGLAVVVRVGYCTGALKRRAARLGRVTQARAGVGNRDAVVHIGGSFGFRGRRGLFFVASLSVMLPWVACSSTSLSKDSGLVGCRNIQRDGLRSEQFRDTHTFCLLRFLFLLLGVGAGHTRSPAYGETRIYG